MVAAGRRKHFYVFDLAAAAVERVAGLTGRTERSLETFAACASADNPLVAFLGNQGCVPLVSLRSRQCVGALKMAGTARAAAFSADGAQLLTSGARRLLSMLTPLLRSAKLLLRCELHTSLAFKSAWHVCRWWLPHFALGRPVGPRRAARMLRRCGSDLHDCRRPPCPHGACGASRRAPSGAGGDGVVHTWDMRTRTCLRRDVDEGCLTATALAAAPSGRLFAAGADSGVVNVYSRGPGAEAAGAAAERGPGANLVPSKLRRPCAARQAPPLRALTNLTTTIDTLAFSPDSQARHRGAARSRWPRRRARAIRTAALPAVTAALPSMHTARETQRHTLSPSGKPRGPRRHAQMLAMASRMKRDALRLVHVPSLTVFANWPTSRTPLGHVHSAAFSPGGGFLAIGNAKGRVLLYRLHHYAAA